MIAMKLALWLHLLSAGVVLSTGLFLDFVLVPNLRALPPDEATKLGTAVQPLISYVSWAAIALLGLSGAYLLYGSGAARGMFTAGWLGTGRGLAMAAKLACYSLIVAAGAVNARLVAPRLAGRLPFEVRRHGARMGPELGLGRWLVRGSAVAAALAIVFGGFDRFGGF